MLALLDAVYRHRLLASRLEVGAGLDIEQIQELSALEAELTPETIVATVELRGTSGMGDLVTLGELGPGVALCHHCPWAEEGDVVDLVVEHGDCSYRFKARVAWTDEDESGDLDVGLELVGVPVLLRRGPRRATTERDLVAA